MLAWAPVPTHAIIYQILNPAINAFFLIFFMPPQIIYITLVGAWVLHFSHLMSGILLFFPPMFSLLTTWELPGLPSPMLLETKLSFLALFELKDSFRLVGLLKIFEEPSVSRLGLTDSLAGEYCSLAWAGLRLGLRASFVWFPLKASFPCCCLYGSSPTGLLTPFTVGILPVGTITFDADFL